MSREKTTLEEMKKAENERDLADAKKEELREVIGALSSGTAANIEGMRVKLLEEGRVVVYPGGEVEFVLSERQFRGLMGWGAKHFGGAKPENGAKNEDEKGESGITPTQPPPAGRTR